MTVVSRWQGDQERYQTPWQCRWPNWRFPYYPQHKDASSACHNACRTDLWARPRLSESYRSRSASYSVVLFAATKFSGRRPARNLRRLTGEPDTQAVLLPILSVPNSSGLGFDRVCSRCRHNARRRRRLRCSWPRTVDRALFPPHATPRGQYYTCSTNIPCCENAEQTKLYIQMLRRGLKRLAEKLHFSENICQCLKFLVKMKAWPETQINNFEKHALKYNKLVSRQVKRKFICLTYKLPLMR